MMKMKASGRAPRRGRKFGAVVAVAVALAALSAAAPALATPKGAFAIFSNCPLTISESCSYSKTTSGEFVLGNQAVPITNPIYLESGFVENPINGEEELIGAINGKPLSHSPQNVPGGLSDLVNCKEISNSFERELCEWVFENKFTGVEATAELAGTGETPISLNAGNLLEETGTVFILPVKIHLENYFLGSECYIGSDSSPIDIPLTTGATSPPSPNKSISGTSGSLEFPEEGKIDRIANSSLVNNSFAAPGANGCGGEWIAWLLDPIIDAKLGLPAAAGHNTAILSNTTISQAAVKYVKESE